MSHASEDKDRFVLGFATQLRANGVDAWLDRWEMLPGDSLVDKIFEEGVKEASAFIVVLSKVSVEKKWVREEMNAAFVARISRQCKVIPIMIDHCEVPEALKTTLWERIEDLSNYNESLKRIVAAIFGGNERPPIGTPPAFLSSDSILFAPDLERIDAAVLWLLCEVAMKENQNVIVDMTVLDALKVNGVAESDITDSLEVLDQHGFIKASHVLGGGYCGSGISHVSVTLSGMNLFARKRFPDFDAMVSRIAALIVNENVQQGAILLEKTGYGELIVEHIVDVLENNNLLTARKHYGGFYVASFSPSLKRMLRSG